MGVSTLIIVCAQCETRFQLDDARIPAKGAKVRCSRCKHAFFVRRPGASEADAVDEVVAEATEPGASTAPPATRDLAEAGAREAGEGGVADWEFNDPPSAGASSPTDAASPAPASAAAEPSEGADAVGAPEERDAEADAFEAPAPSFDTEDREAESGEEDLDALGNPEEWNLLGDAPPPARSEADDPLDALLGHGATEEVPPAPAAAESRREPEPDAEARAAAAPAKRARGAGPRAREALAERLPALGSVGAGAGWMASLALLGFALFALGSRALEPTVAPAPQPRTLTVADGRAAAVEGGYVDNALVGPLYVVSGRYEVGRLDDTRGLEVQLLDARGEVIPGATAWAGPALSEVQLRERAPEVLRDTLARGADELAWAPEGRFQAVFAALPPGAADFTLRARPLPWKTPPPPAPLPSSE